MWAHDRDVVHAPLQFVFRVVHVVGTVGMLEQSAGANSWLQPRSKRRGF